MFESIWKEELIEKRPQLEGNKQTEVAVIGAGLAGILIAYYLQKNGKKVIVLEADRIGSGMTSNTTAKITSQHNLIYKKLITNFGQEKAKEYAEYNERAVKEYETLIKELQIPCDFEKKDSYVYSKEETKLLEEELQAARSLGINASITTETALPFPIYGAVKFPEQAQFHPIKFVKALAQHLEIYEKTMVKKRKGEHLLQVSVWEDEKECEYEVQADTIILANHYPMEKIKGLYALRMYQEREKILVIEEPHALPYGMYVAANNKGYSFRKYDKYVIVAGKNYRPGEQTEQDAFAEMENEVKQYYSQGTIAYHMVNQDCITLDKVPYIGRLTKGMENVYIATGFNKWGMSHAMVSALLLTEMICKGEDKKNSIFRPNRFAYKASKKELKQHMVTVIRQIALKPVQVQKKIVDQIEPEQGHILKKNGKRLAVYKEKDGTVYSFHARCPHLGCLLEWNKEEQSWDCPCHGSRFTKKGELINGPAKKDMKQ
ncbi:FAD-dependent oxidoreductase [Anaerosporobacter faecicola]|uniref:FAD-dependent oxidoreductase n=1 Tax=Anaerosporobacter faecicola TaxID=2718714 RepID=UPI00143BADD9|nr:FAD-dependent oxidoreductase [Anaerosporobacter faecicola]